MAEVTCPSPFSVVGSLAANIQVECVPYTGARTVSWNPSDKNGNVVLSGEDLTTTMNDGNWGGVRDTISKSSGKWYWEICIDTAERHVPGIGTSAAILTSYVGKDAFGYGYYDSNGKKIHNNAEVAYGDSFTAGDIIGTALDLDNGKIWWSKNGVWQASGNPITGTNPAFTGIVGTFFPMLSEKSVGTAATARFIATDFTHSPPAGFSAIDPGTTDAFMSVGSLSSEPECLWVDIDSPLSSVSSLSAILQPQISGSTFSAVSSSLATPTSVVPASAFSAVSVFTCDHCFNYAQVAGTCPTPTSKIDAVFRWARIDASPPVPTGSFKVGRIIEGDCPVPDFTCIAYHGRNPSLIADAPCPTCSMRTGLSLSDVATISRKAGVPIPTCFMVATTHHVATIYGNMPCPLFTCTADTENITILTASAPCPRGLFEVTVGNVADILGRTPCPTCSIVAITGEVITLSGSVPVPGSLVRFYASPMNVNITLNGAVPVPTMISCVSGLTSLILRHIRGEVR